MLSIDEALARVLAEITPLGAESVSLLDALGRVCAEEVQTEQLSPRFDNSAMDGYAVRAGDTSGASDEAPLELRVVARVGAGDEAQRPLANGEAARIFTGAPIPAGADAVVMQERVEVRDGIVILRAPVPLGNNVRRAGEDLRPGDVLLRAGMPIAAGEIAALASQGRSWLQVFRRPRVTIVCTGNELVEIDRSPGPAQILNSNSLMIAAQVLEAGAAPARLPIALDDPERITAALTEAARTSDLVLTSGGVSVGDFDHVSEVLSRSGTVSFHKVALKPGKPVAFGRIGATPLVGLPGNPVSSYVCFELFARPAILRLAGHTHVERPRLHVRVGRTLKRDAKRRELVRATLERRDGELWAQPFAQQGSAHLRSLVGVDALVDVSPGDGTLEAGATASALVLRPQ